MLSVGSRDDARKGAAFGLAHKSGGAMDEDDAEEGETCSIHADDATAIDPEGAFSYIDEKIQDILGHFQKDFEGGVSVENLGSKFGGYGSFLPSCPPTPSILSHPRSAERAPNCKSSMSACNLPAEVACGNSAVLTSKIPLKNNSFPVAPQLDDTKKHLRCLSTPVLGEFNTQSDLIKIPFRSNDQKVPKLRIKIGSDIVFPRPNASIYSNMGLDYSTSSSPADSPVESGGFSFETEDAPDESPMSILKIMTGFCVPGECILSPLPEHVLTLMENEKLSPRDCKSGTFAIGGETYCVLNNNALMGNFPLGRKGNHVEDINNSNSKVELRNEYNIEMPKDSIVSDSLNTPIHSSSGDADKQAEREMLRVDASFSDRGSDKEIDFRIAEVNGSGISQESNKILGKDKSFSCDLSKGEASESLPSLQGKPNIKTWSSDMVMEGREMHNHKCGQFDQHNKTRRGTEKCCDALVTATDVLKGLKDIFLKPSEPIKLKATPMPTLFQREGEKVLQARNCSLVMKTKTKASEPRPEEHVKGVSSALPKEKSNNPHSNRGHLEDKQSALESHKESTRILSKEFNSLGEAKVGPVQNGTHLMKTIFRNKRQDPRIGSEKDISTFPNKAKERLNVKKVEESPISEADRTNSCVIPSTAHGPVSDAALGPSSHDIILDNWVCCDRCQKWRLLPHATDPMRLPNKWICAMLNWLPGMNKCNISEEETTRALHSLYQAPLPENPSTVDAPNNEATQGAIFTGVQHLDQNHYPSFHPSSGYGKKKNMPKDVACHAVQLSSSVKRNEHVFMKHGSSSENQVKSNALNKLSSESSKKKQKLVESCSNTGVLLEQNERHSKSKSKRNSDQGDCRTSKKYKTEEAHKTDVDSKATYLSVLQNDLPSKATSGSLIDSDDYSSFKNPKCNSNDSLSGDINKSKASVKVLSTGQQKEQFNNFFLENFDEKYSPAKKRKEKEQLECQVNHLGVVNSVSLANDVAKVKEEISESESRKGKRARILKTDKVNTVTIRMAGKTKVKEVISETESRKGKGTGISKTLRLETPTIKMVGKFDKRSQVARVLSSSKNAKENVLDGMEKEKKSMTENEKKGRSQDSAESESNLSCLASKRDLSCVQISTTAPSKLSKVSCSPKRKTNFQEARSPVESVSSSPLRISSVHRSKKSSIAGDNAGNTSCSSVLGNQRRCSKVVVIGQVEQYGNMMRDKSFSVVNDGSLVAYRNADFDHNKGASDSHSNYGDLQKSCKNSSSQPKEKHRSSKSDVDNSKCKNFRSFSEKEEIASIKHGNSLIYDADVDSVNRLTYHENLSNERCKVAEKKDKKKSGSVRKCPTKCRKDGKLSFGVEENPVGSNLSCEKHKDAHSSDCDTETISTRATKSFLHDYPKTRASHEDKKSSNCLISDQTAKLETAPGRGKPQPLPHSGDKQITSFEDPHTVLPSARGGRSELSSVDVLVGDTLTVPKQPKKVDSQNGEGHGSLSQHIDALNPFGRDGNNVAAGVAYKEARDLKHVANRLKNGGLEHESIVLQFESALKFLHVASLLESAGAENGKHGEPTQSMAMYSDTAKLCDFCAHEFEKCKDMAAAALAYKCKEVAYMKLIFSKYSCASKDQQELLTAFHMVPSGESPSSSASDIDNVNNLATLDKTSTKVISSPQMSDILVIPAHNLSASVRLVDFVQHVNYAMEASRKSHIAFKAANINLEDSHYGAEGISSVRRVLDFNFHDVEGLLYLVRLSMDFMNR